MGDRRGDHPFGRDDSHGSYNVLRPSLRLNTSRTVGNEVIGTVRGDEDPAAASGCAAPHNNRRHRGSASGGATRTPWTGGPLPLAPLSRPVWPHCHFRCRLAPLPREDPHAQLRHLQPLPARSRWHPFRPRPAQRPLSAPWCSDTPLLLVNPAQPERPALERGERRPFEPTRSSRQSPATNVLCAYLAPSQLFQSL